jgi:hypothetical protein
MFTKLNGLPTNEDLSGTYAKKSDIAGVYKYKGTWQMQRSCRLQDG